MHLWVTCSFRWRALSSGTDVATARVVNTSSNAHSTILIRSKTPARAPWWSMARAKPKFVSIASNRPLHPRVKRGTYGDKGIVSTAWCQDGASPSSQLLRSNANGTLPCILQAAQRNKSRTFRYIRLSHPLITILYGCIIFMPMDSNKSYLFIFVSIHRSLQPEDMLILRDGSYGIRCVYYYLTCSHFVVSISMLDNAAPCLLDTWMWKLQLILLILRSGCFDGRTV